MTKAKLIIKERQHRSADSFIELSIHQVPVPLQGSRHHFKYRLAFVVRGECVMRYDNEAGKGDHKHMHDVETPITFVDLATLLREFRADVERLER